MRTRDAFEKSMIEAPKKVLALAKTRVEGRSLQFNLKLTHAIRITVFACVLDNVSGYLLFR